jgi:hypothetical protein
MTTPFDASLVYTGPIGEDVLASQRHEVERTMRMSSALGNAKFHASRELDRWVLACNRLVWGEMPSEVRAPTQQEIIHLLEQLSPENRERLLKESRLAAEQRSLLALLSEAEAEAIAKQRAEEAEDLRIAAEQREREEFEAYDLAGKEARFRAWRASR